jgi:hypothetical protein
MPQLYTRLSEGGPSPLTADGLKSGAWRFLFAIIAKY